MRYRDLVQFDPIISVIQLRDADQLAAARQMVRSYVISDGMASHLTEIVFPQLQIDTPNDNKGILIVGNYGTGKSHLLSVISSIAEHADLLPDLTHDGVKQSARSIAGKFKVLRVEIGAVERSLRNIILSALQEKLAEWGTPYTFPPADQINDNKVPLIQAVDEFKKKYPDQGILLVVDELLDYLRTRDNHAIIADLGFMREMGEVAASTRFRMIAGLQETLFDSPRFTFVAGQLQRVKDRYEQVRIDRQDIAYVVAHRLLKKTDAQRQSIHTHLSKFTPFYKHMAEQLDEYETLFPIHPKYIDTLEKVSLAEKREILKTFSKAIESILDQQVPQDQPGLISFDQYWGVLCDNPSLRAMEGVAEVVDKSGVLESKITSGYTRPVLKPMALRIIHALSVFRLTTDDLHAPIGLTAEELRDDLCLYIKTPDHSAEMLLDQVHVALKEMLTTVSGQYISHSSENGQYYLDLQRVVDFDMLVKTRGDVCSKSDLNMYFFDALRRVLQLSSTTYVTNFNIWSYQLPWDQHKVTRPGYLFLGPPDERSTAQPPRDFYVYWLPPFLDRPWHNPKLPDEVIYELKGLDADFEALVRAYAGSQAMANESVEYRTEYARMAEQSLKTFTAWLTQNLVSHLHIWHEGVSLPIREVVQKLPVSESRSISDLVSLTASHLLSPEFEDRYPDYPAFRAASAFITEESRKSSAMEAVYALAGRNRTQLASVVLNGLQLLDTAGTIRTSQSPYAQQILQKLSQKAEGQVLNRGEIFEQITGGVYPIEKDLTHHLEPEWMVVVLLALVWSGELVINLDGKEELDASTLPRVATLGMDALTNFRNVHRPRGFPLPVWRSIFEHFSLAPGLIADDNTREQAVPALQKEVRLRLEKVVSIEDQLNRGIRFWNEPIFTDRTQIISEAGVVVSSDAPEDALTALSFQPAARGYRKFLEALEPFNTVGKLTNLKLTIQDVVDAGGYYQDLTRLETLIQQVSSLQTLSGYLVEAGTSLPAEHAWMDRAADVKAKTLAGIRAFGRGEKAAWSSLTSDLQALIGEYRTAYTSLHQQMTLNQTADERRQALYNDPRLKMADELSTIDLLRSAAETNLNTWKKNLASLKTCREFHPAMLEQAPVCRSCHLRPTSDRGISAEHTLTLLDEQLDTLVANWLEALRNALQSDTAQTSISAMAHTERQPIQAFLESKDLQELPRGFAAAANRALRGMTAVALPAADLLDALQAGGMPCPPDELKRRFESYLQKALHGHDADTTRFTLER